MGVKAEGKGGKGRQCGLLRFLILSHALIHGRTYGYGVLKEVVKLSDGAWHPSVGTIYKVISELVSEGHLREAGKEVCKGRQVVYYVITEAGIRELKRIADWVLRRVGTGVKFLTMLYAEMIKSGVDFNEVKDAVNAFKEMEEVIGKFLREYGNAYG